MFVAGGEQLVIKARALLVVSVVVPAVLCWAMLLGDDRARYYGVLVPLAVPVGAVFVAVSACSTSVHADNTRAARAPLLQSCGLVCCELHVWYLELSHIYVQPPCVRHHT